MKTIFCHIVTLLAISCAWGQNKINCKVYGFVRGDAAYDTRVNVAGFEGLLTLYPADRLPDVNGADLNKLPSSGFFAFNSRAGIDVTGLDALGAKVFGRLEGDFAGFSAAYGSNSSLLRIRQAFIRMDWNKSSLLAGQTWHPFFTPVSPDVISLSVGAPFNPFNRSPMVKFDYRPGRLTLSAAAIYQFQFTSNGVAGKSNTYQHFAVCPELFLGADYHYGDFTAGAGLRYLSLKPRVSAPYSTGGTVKVDESLGSASYMAYLKYAKNLFTVSAKTIYGGNLSDLTMLGGYAVSDINAQTSQQEYTNFTHSTTWLGGTYGKKYKAGLFGGFTKNLGTAKDIVNGMVYGDGLKINELYRLSATFSFNISNFMLGAEYEGTMAAYGDAGTMRADGRYSSSHDVVNHRLVGVISYNF